MANGGAAYQQLKVPDNYVGQALSQLTEVTARENAARKLKEERADVRKQEQISAWEKENNMKVEDFLLKATGNASWDDVQKQFANNVSDKYVEKTREAKEALVAGDIARNRALTAELVKIKGTFKNDVETDRIFGENYKAYQEAVAKGQVSGASKEFEDIMNAVLVDNNVVKTLDKDNNIVYRVKTTDENGKIVIKDIKNADIRSGKFNYIKKQKISGKDGIVEGVLVGIGKKVKNVIGDKEYLTTTKQVWDTDSANTAKQHIAVFTGDDNTMADLLNQFTGSTKTTRFNDDEKDLVEDRMIKLIRGGYDESEGKETVTADASYRLQLAGLNIQRQNLGIRSAEHELALKKAKVELDKSLKTITATPVLSPNGNIRISQYTITGAGKTDPTKGYVLNSEGNEPITGIISKDPSEAIISIEVDENNNVYAWTSNSTVTTKRKGTGLEESLEEGSESESTKIVKTVTNYKKLNENEVAKLSKRMGAKDSADMIKKLSGGGEGEVEDPLGIL